MTDADKRLILQAQRGDTQAFETLYNQHLKRVYNIAWRMMGNDADAQDVTQEVMLKAWRALPGGPSLLAGEERELARVSPDFPEAAAAQVRDWQGAVLDLVREQGADKRSRARLLSWGVNGAGAVVMVAVFAQTGGLTGGEVAVAGGTTAVGQRVLEAVFGDAAVRSLAERARADLRERADALLRYEQDRFDVRVDDGSPDEATAAELRAAVAALSDARRAA